MKLIVGLGNPGKEYADTRHNIGFRCINRFARQHNISIEKRWCRARIGLGRVGEEDLILAKPQTFMNRSGESVAMLVKKEAISTENILVIYDDLDLPLGKMRFRHAGGSAGHKGIESVIACLGSEKFPRLKMGIGRPMGDHDVVPYVLGRFAPSEKEIAEQMIQTAADAVTCFLIEGILIAMDEYN